MVPRVAHALRCCTARGSNAVLRDWFNRVIVAALTPRARHFPYLHLLLTGLIGWRDTALATAVYLPSRWTFYYCAMLFAAARRGTPHAPHRVAA